MKKLSIVIPVYNEVNSIDSVIESVLTEKVDGYQKEVLVIDDGSTDGTKEKLRKWDKKCIVIYQNKNSGKGSAIRNGLQKVSGDLILIQDADFEYSPSNYKVLLEPFDNPNVNVVYGSRFLGPHLSTMFIYAQGNKFVTLITNLLFNTNITDMETGFKVFRKEVFNNVSLQSNRFEFEPEITTKVLKKGYQIYEVPISYFGRKFSEGKKLTWKDGVYALWTILKYRFVS
jgi:glycosyltransferase involved in cell wall biosynthesis